MFDAARWADDDEPLDDDAPEDSRATARPDPISIYSTDDIPEWWQSAARGLIERLLQGPATAVQLERTEAGASARPMLATLTERVINLCEYDDGRVALIDRDGRRMIVGDPSNPMAVFSTAVQGSFFKGAA